MIKDINSFFEGFQQANKLKLVSHHWGDFWNAWSSRLLRYPNITTYSVTKGITNKKVDTYDVTVTISDMVRNDDSNLIDVENSTLQICRDVFDAMRVHFSIVNSSVSIRFFRQSGGDVVAGHTFVVTIQEVGKSNCGGDMKLAPCRSVALYVNDVKIGDFINDVNLTLKDTQGNDVDFTVNENHLVVNDLPAVCLDANYLVEYANGAPIESGTIPSGGSATIQVPNPITCADATVNIVDSNSNPIGSVTVPSGGSDTFVVEDLPCSVDSKEWIIEFDGQVAVAKVTARTSNIATFTSDSGTDVGTIEISTDNINFTPISYPFTPVNGTAYYFKRSTNLVSGIYQIFE